jgi:GDP-4-dehydro-6-deoxy-D-mannose reductase
MRVLILGATGFVGRHLLAECRSRGDEIVATYRVGETIPESTGADWLPVDLLEEPTIRRAVEAARPEGVVHLAAQASVALAHEDPFGTFRVNAEGSYRVLHAVSELARRSRVILVSSAEVYGKVAPEDLPVTEEHPMNPRTPYGVSKTCAEIAACQAVEAWGIEVVRVRPFNHVGPGQRTGFVAPDFASQVASIERGDCEPVLRVGNLSSRRDFTDVRDIARGYRDALEGARAGSAYNLCSNTAVAIEEIVSFFVSRSSAPIEIRQDPKRVRPVEVLEIRGVALRAERDFGWEPKISFEQSLAEVLEEWRFRAACASSEVPHPPD